MNPLVPDPFDVEVGRLVRAVQSARPGVPIRAAARRVTEVVAVADGAARGDATSLPDVDDSLLSGILEAVCADAREAGVDLEQFTPHVIEARRTATS